MFGSIKLTTAEKSRPRHGKSNLPQPAMFLLLAPREIFRKLLLDRFANYLAKLQHIQILTTNTNAIRIPSPSQLLTKRKSNTKFQEIYIEIEEK